MYSQCTGKVHAKVLQNLIVLCVYPAVCTALTAICKLISQDLINAVLPGVTALLSHPKELVRKKAVMALHRFQQLDPDHEGALSGMDFDRHFRQALCDKASPLQVSSSRAAE